MAQMNKAREALVNGFLKLLEKDENYTWKKGWKTDYLPPENGKTGKRYRGVNQLLLTLTAYEKGYTDNRWFTFTQASEQGYQIKKGAEGIPIEFWSYYDIKAKKNISREEYDRIRTEEPERDMEKDFRIVSKVFYVFNGADVEGLEPLPVAEQKRKAEKPAFFAKEFCNNLSDGMGVVVEKSENRAYYDIKNDRIHIPEKEKFYSEYGFYSTLLHELAHSTGSKDRMDRDMTGRFGSESYAKEELRAELSSCFLSAELGMSTEEDNQEHIDNHKAYVSSWLKMIKEKPEELFRAIKDAEAITDYMSEKGNLVKVQERYAGLQPDTAGRILYYNFSGEIERKEDFTDWVEFQHAVGKGIESGENMEAIDLFESPAELLEEFRKEAPHRRGKESFDEQVERIGKWEKEHNIPSVNRITGWFGDYAMYELQSGIDYREIEKREIQIMQSEAKIKDATQIPAKEKISVAIESTEDFMDFKLGFSSMSEPQGIKYRLVTAEGGRMIPYPDDATIFYSREDCEEYTREHMEELEVIGYDDITVAAFAQRSAVRLSEKISEDNEETVSEQQEAAAQTASSLSFESDAQTESLELEGDEKVKELVTLLKENNMEEQSNNVTEIFLRLDEIGKNLAVMLKEAKELYQQIEKEESLPEQVKQTVKEAYSFQEKRDADLQEQVEEVKGDIRNRSQQIVADFKEKGKEALYQVSEFFNLKDRLFLMYAKTEQRIAATRKTIEKLESFGTGIREASQRTANAFRNLLDKNEVDYSSKDRKISKTDIFLKPFQWREKSYEFIARQLDAAIQTVENIGRTEPAAEIESHEANEEEELQLTKDKEEIQSSDLEKEARIEDITQALNNRETSHNGIGHDVAVALKPYSTEELIQYFSNVIMHQDNGEHLRQYLEEQIINNEIGKEQEKAYSALPVAKAAAR